MAAVALLADLATPVAVGRRGESGHHGPTISMRAKNGIGGTHIISAGTDTAPPDGGAVTND
jgi:hypothetical protein